MFVEYLLIHICYFPFTKARTEPTAAIACLPGVIAEPDVETEDATLEDIKKIPQVVIAHPPPPATAGEAGGALRNSVRKG